MVIVTLIMILLSEGGRRGSSNFKLKLRTSYVFGQPEIARAPTQLLGTLSSQTLSYVFALRRCCLFPYFSSRFGKPTGEWPKVSQEKKRIHFTMTLLVPSPLLPSPFTPCNRSSSFPGHPIGLFLSSSFCFLYPHTHIGTLSSISEPRASDPIPRIRGHGYAMPPPLTPLLTCNE